VPYAEEIIGEYQGGFRRGRSTFDKIFTMRQILRKKNWEQNMYICTIHNLFTDFQAPYVTVWRRKYGVKCINYVPPPNS